MRLGKVDLRGNSDNAQPYDYDVVDVKTHPEYIRRPLQNDLALLKLKTSVQNTENIHPACLHTGHEDPNPPLVATGWGDTQPGQLPSDILQQVSLKAVPVSECNITYMRRIGKPVIKKQICAGSDDNTDKDACTVS